MWVTVLVFRGMSYFLTISCPLAGGGEKLLHFGSHRALNEFVHAGMAVPGRPAPPGWDEEGWGEPVRAAAVAEPLPSPGWDDAVWGVPEKPVAAFVAAPRPAVPRRVVYSRPMGMRFPRVVPGS